MSANQRTFKLLCLILMILGIVVLVDGIVLGAASFAPLVTGCAVALEGVLATFAGYRGARLANVPAQVGAARPLLITSLVFGAALACASMVVEVFGASVAAAISAGLPALIALIALVYVSRVLVEVDR